MIEQLAIFRAAISTHAEASEFLLNLDQLVAVQVAPDPFAKLQMIRQFLQNHVRAHFAYEEDELFPAVLQLSGDSHTAQTITDLRADHRHLLPRAERLDTALAGATRANAEQLLTQTTEEFRTFFGDLQRHARREDAFLVPLVESILRRSHQPPPPPPPSSL